jgi:hypothetical protein
MPKMMLPATHNSCLKNSCTHSTSCLGIDMSYFGQYNNLYAKTSTGNISIAGSIRFVAQNRRYLQVQPVSSSAGLNEQKLE